MEKSSGSVVGGSGTWGNDNIGELVAGEFIVGNLDRKKPIGNDGEIHESEESRLLKKDSINGG